MGTAGAEVPRSQRNITRNKRRHTMEPGKFICVYYTGGAWGVPPCVHDSLKEAQACVDSNRKHYREEFFLEEVTIAEIKETVTFK